MSANARGGAKAPLGRRPLPPGEALLPLGTRVPAGLLARVTACARHAGLSISAWVRRAVEMFADEQESREGKEDRW